MKRRNYADKKIFKEAGVLCAFGCFAAWYGWNEPVYLQKCSGAGIVRFSGAARQLVYRKSVG
jgi:hypothetical protein